MTLGDLEREVMTHLWAAGEPLTVRQVHERLSRDRDLAYTTVMTVLDRLAKKGVVTQERADRAYRYLPAQTREELTAGLMLDALSATPDQDAALAHFVGRLSPEALAAAIKSAQRAEPGENGRGRGIGIGIGEDGRGIGGDGRGIGGDGIGIGEDGRGRGEKARKGT